MLLDKILARPNSDEINVIIEIPMNGSHVKYEFDKVLNALVVDRFIPTPMFYPCNYGFIPNTLSGDNDPLDVLLISNYPVMPGCVVKARPIGVLIMEDESGLDEKIVALPAHSVDPSFDNIKEMEDLPQSLKDKIVHFFEHYKDLEKKKWVKIIGFDEDEKAEILISEAISSYVTASKDSVKKKK